MATPLQTDVMRLETRPRNRNSYVGRYQRTGRPGKVQVEKTKCMDRNYQLPTRASAAAFALLGEFFDGHTTEKGLLSGKGSELNPFAKWMVTPASRDSSRSSASSLRRSFRSFALNSKGEWGFAVADIIVGTTWPRTGLPNKPGPWLILLGDSRPST